MTDSPEMAAYRATRPDLYILMQGGVWNASEPLYTVQVAPRHRAMSPLKPVLRVFQYKARRIGAAIGLLYEVYSVETGEVVGRIN